MILSPSFSLFIYYVTNPFLLDCPSHFQVEEITNSCYQQLDDERTRRIAVVQLFSIADQSRKDLRKKLTKEERARNSADSALEST